MNILELNFERLWRGGERQTLYNMIGFRKAGINVALLCRKDCPLEVKAKAEGFETFAFSNIFGAIIFFIFKCRKFQVLHAQSSHILTYAVFTKKFHRAKIIFTRRIYKIPQGRLTKWKYNLSDRIVAISDAIKKVMENFINRNVFVISDIVEQKILDADRAIKLVENSNIKSSTFLIGTTAALTEEKAPFVMIEAIRLLFEKRKDFVFLHFGSGLLEDEMKKLIEKYNLENVYHLMGFIENAEDVFSILNVFVMSSEMEGLGSSVLDAFIYKVPVVSTDAGGLADLVKDGRGISCKKNSPEMLASGIDKMLSGSELQTEVKTKSFTYVKEFHSMEYITNQYLELVNSLLAKNKN
jgi:glycosyltransferase involved in cell wall biosynthesis